MARNEFIEYYKKVFKEAYRTPEEADMIGEHTYNFVYHCLENQECFKPLFKFFVDISFEGPDEYQKPLIEKLIREKAYLGVTRFDLKQLGDEILMALDPKSLNQEEFFKEDLFEVFEQIRKADSEYRFYELDWDFFVLQMNASHGFSAIFTAIDDKNELTPFGETVKEKAEACGMTVIIDTIPEDDIEKVLSSGNVKNPERIREVLSTKHIAFLDYEALGDFGKELTPILALTKEDLERYENNRQEQGLLRLSSKR